MVSFRNQYNSTRQISFETEDARRKIRFPKILWYELRPSNKQQAQNRSVAKFDCQIDHSRCITVPVFSHKNSYCCPKTILSSLWLETTALTGSNCKVRCSNYISIKWRCIGSLV